MDALIFIDTNIMLDFYRIRAGGAGLSVLKHIDQNKGIIITGNQVEMEFKKNRQGVLKESLQRIKKTPEWSCLEPPAFLETAKPVKAIETSKNQLIKLQKTLKRRLESILKKPVRCDPVFQALQRLFNNKGPYNLDRTKKNGNQIGRMAWKRFLLV